MSTLTTLLSLTKPDGGDPALISVINANMDILDNAVTLTSAQTLTNKTLTGPHMSAPVVDSGGLTITAGALTVVSGDLSVFKAASSGQTTLALRPADDANPTVAVIAVQNAAGAANNFTVTKAGGMKLVPGAFVAADKYLVVDSNGNVHVSALGPAS